MCDSHMMETSFMSVSAGQRHRHVKAASVFLNLLLFYLLSVLNWFYWWQVSVLCTKCIGIGEKLDRWSRWGGAGEQVSTREWGHLVAWLENWETEKQSRNQKPNQGRVRHKFFSHPKAAASQRQTEHGYKTSTLYCCRRHIPVLAPDSQLT